MIGTMRAGVLQHYRSRRPLLKSLIMLIAAAALTAALASCDEDDDDDDAPPITVDQVRPHEHAGQCTTCHRILPGRHGGTRRFAPEITHNQLRPHPDRGACAGCHVIKRVLSRTQ